MLVELDGFDIETIICIVVEFAWLCWGRRIIRNLQSKDESTWKVR